MKFRRIPRTTSLLLIFILFSTLSSHAQHLTEILNIPWDTIDGVKTAKGFDYPKKGIPSFKMITDNKVAILCSVEKKVKVYELQTGKLNFEFPIKSGVSFLTCDTCNMTYFLADSYHIYLYDSNGIFQQKHPVSDGSILIMNLFARSDTISIFASGTRSHIISIGTKILIEDPYYDGEIEGRILNNGTIANYDVNFTNKSTRLELSSKTKISYHNIPKSSNSSGHIPIGICSDKLILLESQKNYYNSFDLVIYSLKSENVVQRRSIPKTFYMSQKKSLELFNGKVYYLLPTPSGAKLFTYMCDTLHSITKSTN